MFISSLVTIIAPTLFVGLALAPVDVLASNEHHLKPRHAHKNIARDQSEVPALGKRADHNGAKATFYDVGRGACGDWNVESDFIVALNSGEMNMLGGGWPSKQCNKKISISYKGKSTTATIKDECPGCPWGGLDFSRGLFKFFASEDEGIIFVDWSYSDGSSSPETTTKKADPTTTSKKPTSTSTQEEETTSTSSTRKTTSTTSESETSSSAVSTSSASSTGTGIASSSSVSVSHSGSSAISSASPTATTSGATPSETASIPGGNIDAINRLVANYGNMVYAAAIAT